MQLRKYALHTEGVTRLQVTSVKLELGLMVIEGPEALLLVQLPNLAMFKGLGVGMSICLFAEVRPKAVLVVVMIGLRRGLRSRHT